MNIKRSVRKKGQVKSSVDPKQFVEDFCSIVPKNKRKRLSVKEIKKIRDEQYELP